MASIAPATVSYVTESKAEGRRPAIYSGHLSQSALGALLIQSDALINAKDKAKDVQVHLRSVIRPDVFLTAWFDPDSPPSLCLRNPAIQDSEYVSSRLADRYDDTVWPLEKHSISNSLKHQRRREQFRAAVANGLVQLDKTGLAKEGTVQVYWFTTKDRAFPQFAQDT